MSKHTFGLLFLLLLVAACGPTPTIQVTPERTTVDLVSPEPALSQPPAPASLPTTDPGDVHRPEGAGRWYPADPEKLQAALDTYIGQAEIEPIPGSLLAVIVPHAGYVYSGVVAGHAFRALQEAGCADHTIAVIGDTHSGNGSADIAVWADGVFETP
jgi:hypothetical protein